MCRLYEDRFCFKILTFDTDNSIVLEYHGTQCNTILYLNSSFNCVFQLLLRQQLSVKDVTLTIKRNNRLVIWRICNYTLNRMFYFWILPTYADSLRHILYAFFSHGIPAYPSRHSFFTHNRHWISVDDQDSKRFI